MTAKHSWPLTLVLIAVVSDYVGVTMMRVSLPFYAKTLGGSSTFIGALETGYGVGQWVGATTLPRISDVLGRRRILVLCCFCSAVGYMLAVSSIILGKPMLLLLSRLPVGLAKQTVTISRAVVADCTQTSEDRSRWMAFQCTALATGCCLGPLLASKASELIHDSAPVAIASALFTVLGPTVAFTLPETSCKVPSEDDKDVQATQDQPLWRCKKVLLVLFILALPELGLVSHQGVSLNAYSMQYLGMGKPWIAKLTSISALLQALFAGTICAALSSRGWTDVSALKLGTGSFALASMAIWWWQSPNAVMYSAPAAAFANSVLRSFPAALLSKYVPAHRQGAAMGLLDVCSSALRVLAPVLAGLCMDTFGGSSVFFGQAVLFILASVGLLILPKISSEKQL